MSGYLLALITYVTPLSLSMLAHGSIPFSAGQVTCCLFSGLRRNGEKPSCFPEYSCSLCSTSTSCLVFLPILPAWPISVLLKYMIDRIQTILPHHFSLFLFFLTKENTHSPFVGNVGIVFQATSCWLGALIILWGTKENYH